MNLLSETYSSIRNAVLEEDNSTKRYFLVAEEGIQVDKINRNGRIYPKKLIAEELSTRYLDKVQSGRAWGEYGHPDNTILNERNISHRFTEIKENGTNYYSIKAVLLDNQWGNFIKSLISDGEGQVGMSTRAVGTLKETGGVQYVVAPFELITAGDVVIDPSAQTAFIKGVVEGREFEYDQSGYLVEKVTSNVKNQYKNNMTNEEKQNLFVEQFKLFVDFLSKK